MNPGRVLHVARYVLIIYMNTNMSHEHNNSYMIIAVTENVLNLILFYNSFCIEQL